MDGTPTDALPSLQVRNGCHKRHQFATSGGAPREGVRAETTGICRGHFSGVQPMVRSRMGGTVSGASAPRWSPQDRVKALERLANARANLAGLERQDAPTIEPDIQPGVMGRQRQIERLKTDIGKRGRAGRQPRQQVEALEGTQGLVMECL